MWLWTLVRHGSPQAPVDTTEAHLVDTRPPEPDVLALGVAAPTDGLLNVGLLHAPFPNAVDALTSEGRDMHLANHMASEKVLILGIGPIVANCELRPGLR